MAGLLKGVKVLESAQLIITPVATQHLADEGADVIKVESPFRGDYLRDFLGQVKPHKRGHSPGFLAVNRNKKSVAVDLRQPEGRQIFEHLLREADVFFDGNAPGAVEKLRLGYDDLRKIKPSIIYARLSGFGAEGPYAAVPTHGVSMQAVGGTFRVERNDKGFVDRTADPTGTVQAGGNGGPLYAAYAIAAALFRRSKTGEGAYIDIGVADTLVADANAQILRHFADVGEDETGMSTAATGGDNPKYNYYETKDGKFVLTALIEHHLYQNFCKALGREDLLVEGVGYSTTAVDIDWGPPALRSLLKDIFLTKSQQEWMAFAAEHDTVIAPINLLADIRSDPHLVQREAVVTSEHPTAGPLVYGGNPIKVAGEHFEIYQHAPALGEHTAEVLTGLGYTDDQLDAWRAKGIVN
jgi:crotonobetainyl-CoA:carnitine CoA-transferase CaiB-like acyl-CoA transferase